MSGLEKQRIEVLPGQYTVHRFAAGKSVPEIVTRQVFYWIGQTNEELSIVCGSDIDLSAQQQSGGWAVLKVVGPLEHSMVGVLAGISAALSGANISLFALSTFDTDYVLVQSERLARATQCLREAGHRIMKLD